jgi:hypothetical protein
VVRVIHVVVMTVVIGMLVLPSGLTAVATYLGLLLQMVLLVALALIWWTVTFATWVMVTDASRVSC